MASLDAASTFNRWVVTNSMRNKLANPCYIAGRLKAYNWWQSRTEKEIRFGILSYSSDEH